MNAATITRLRRLAFFALLAALMLVSCKRNGARKAVISELELIKNLDEETIQLFVSYEDMVRSGTSDSDIGEETANAVKLFFQNFDYRILSSQISGDTAAVKVRLTNLDMKSLAHDLCLALIERTADPRTETPDLGTNDYFALLGDVISGHSYKLLTRDIELSLSRTADSDWQIQSTDTLEDDLLCGFISYLNDPYLVTPSEILTLTFDCFLDFSAADWQTYLNMKDIFSMNSSLSDQLDETLAGRIADTFAYEIKNVTISDTSASVTVKIASLDLSAVIADYREKLLAYAATTEAVRATDAELADKTAQMLCTSLNSVNDTSVQTIDIRFSNNGVSWEMQLGSDFTNAILGNPNEALNALTEAQTEIAAG